MKRDPLMVDIAIPKPKAAPPPAAPEKKRKPPLFGLALALSFIAALFLMWGTWDKKAAPPAEAPAVSGAGTATGGEGGARPEPEAGSTSAGPVPGVSQALVSHITAEPQRPKLGDTITLTPVASRPDVQIPPLVYEWRKNGSNLYNSSNTLKITDEFKRGDKVEVFVTYDDGRGRPGKWDVSAVIINSPPEIVSVTPISRLGENKFGFKINAKDADADALTFSLAPQVEGASIDKATGDVVFSVQPERKGTLMFSVNVTDGQGGNASYNVGFELAPEKK